MRRSIRTLVRVLVTAFSIVTIAVGFSEGGNPLIHPGNGAGNIMIFIGVVVLFGYWSLAWCNWYSTLTVRELHSTALSSLAGMPRQGQKGDEEHAFEDVEDGRQMARAPSGGTRLSAGGT